MSASLTMVEHYVTTHPDDVARDVERLDSGEAVALLAALSAPTAATLLPHLAGARASRLVGDLPLDAAVAILARMGVDDAATLLRRLGPDAATPLLDALDAGQTHSIRALLVYAPATAGGVMDPEILTVPLASTVADVRSLLETTPEHLYYYLYAVDAEHRLAGVFDLAELLQADPAAPVQTIVTPHVLWLAADASLDSVFVHPGWRTLDALPVLDQDRRLLGVLRHRRMRQLREQAAPASGDDRGVRTVMALGEIYWLGLCGLLQGIASTATDSAGQEDLR